MTRSGFRLHRGGLLPPRRPETVEPELLRRVLEHVLPGSATATLRVDLVDDRIDGPVVVLREHERVLRTPLAELAEDLTDAGVTPVPAALAAALRTWVARRPVPDAAAAGGGVAVLDWTDQREVAVAWRVVVRRGDVAVPWVPSDRIDAAALARVRAAAAARSTRVETTLRFEGPVALWSHPEVPLLSSAALVAPERVLARIAECGLAMTDMHVVVTPRRPVACAGAGVAARLAEATGEPCVRLPWRRVPALPWA